MFRGLRIPQILLAVTICIFIPVFSSYLIYCDLADNDPSAEELENPDLDEPFLVSDGQHLLNLFGTMESTALFPVFFPDVNPLEEPPSFSYQAFFLDQETVVLRC